LTFELCILLTLSNYESVFVIVERILFGNVSIV